MKLKNFFLVGLLLIVMSGLSYGVTAQGDPYYTYSQTFTGVAALIPLLGDFNNDGTLGAAEQYPYKALTFTNLDTVDTCYFDTSGNTAVVNNADPTTNATSVPVPPAAGAGLISSVSVTFAVGVKKVSVICTGNAIGIIDARIK